MRLRTFTAPDMPTAMKLVRESLGENAVILNFEHHKGKKAISITAAVDMPDEPAPQAASNHDRAAADRLRFEVQNVLRFHNLPDLFAAKLMNAGRDAALQNAKDIRPYLEKLLAAYFLFDPLPLGRQDMRLMLVGPPGVGKTQAIAKIAAQMTLEKRPLAVITTDNKRAGGVEQLQAFTSILNIELQVATTRAELWQQVRTAGNRPVLIDSSGCNPYDRSELAELSAYAELESMEPVLVLPSGGDSLEVIDMVEVYMSALPLKRLLITRTDMARRFGSVLSAAAAHGLAFCNASRSASIVEAVRPIDSALLAQFMLKYQV